MSIHTSLRGTNSLIGERSVLTRVERLQKLIKDGKFDAEGDSVYGLPKVRTQFKAATKKKGKPEKEEDAAAAEKPAE